MKFDAWYEENKDHIDWSTKESREKFRNTGKWIQFAKELKNERGELCECCSCKSSRLNVHHLWPKEYDNLDRTKFKVLCYSCHTKIQQISRRKDLSRTDDFWLQFIEHN